MGRMRSVRRHQGIAVCPWAQMSGGTGTAPVGPTPRAAKDMGGGRLDWSGEGDVSEDWPSGIVKASTCRKCSVVSSREESSGAGGLRRGDIQPRLARSHSDSRGRTWVGEADNLWARDRDAPRRCIRAGREHARQSWHNRLPSGTWWRRAPGGGSGGGTCGGQQPGEARRMLFWGRGWVWDGTCCTGGPGTCCRCGCSHGGRGVEHCLGNVRA